MGYYHDTTIERIGEELLPCPFCGGKAKHQHYSGAPAIFCLDCPAMMGGEESAATAEELHRAWNSRATLAFDAASMPHDGATTKAGD